MDHLIRVVEHIADFAIIVFGARKTNIGGLFEAKMSVKPRQWGLAVGNF